MKQFQGRVICPGTCEAEALVSHGGFNTLASYQMALMFHDKQVKCGDQNNPDLYKKPMIGKALCLPETIGSTTGGMVLYTACASGQQPACMLFSKHIDSLAASGAILASVWTDADMPVIDCLGDEFLAAVQTGQTVRIRDGGVLTDFDMAYPTLVHDILPTPVLGFFAAVMFGAILSSFNSVLNSSMTLFTLDILPVISKKERTAQQEITIAKRFGIVLCLASIVIAPFLMYLPAGISTFLNQMWGYYGVPVLAVAMMGMLNKNIPNFAPKLTIIVHIIVYGVLMNTVPLHFLYFEVTAFVVDIVLLWACSKFKPRETPYELPNLEVVDMTPWKYRIPVVIVTFAILAAIYITFSPLGVG